MAGDVTIERFDKEKEPLVLSNVREDVTMDELLVTVAKDLQMISWSVRHKVRRHSQHTGD